MINTNANSPRYRVLISAGLLNLCLGAVMAWSVFAAQFRWENPEWSAVQISGVFSVCMFFFSLTTVFSGMAQDKFGPRVVATAGGLLLGLGVIIAACSKSLLVLYLGYGVIGGIGVGTGYVAPIAAAVKWYPDKKGLVAGIVSGSFGCGTLIFAPVGEVLINITGNVADTLLILGIIYLLISIIAAQFLRNPSAEYQSRFQVESEAGASSIRDYTPMEMLKTRNCYLVFGIFFTGCLANLIFLSNAREVIQLFAGLSDAAAVSIVSLVSITNILGGPAYGVICDKIGYKKSLLILMLMASTALFLLPMSRSYFAILAVGLLLMSCVGGLYCLMAVVITELYGSKYLGANYGLLFQSYGLAAIVGPVIAAFMTDYFHKNMSVQAAVSTGYSTAFLINSGLCLLAAILTLLIKPANKGTDTFFASR